MTDKILAKINTEYELFFMQMMSCTKELLYSRSREIEMKKTITSFLRNEVKNNKDIKLIRMSTSIFLTSFTDMQQTMKIFLWMKQ